MITRFFQGTERGLFSIVREPAEASSMIGCAVFVPPFAEEMNKCRRMISLQSQRLASAGYQTWVFDLFGTGDSPGEFEQASIDLWVSDTVQMIEHVAEQSGGKPVCLVAVRFGALLAMAAIARAQVRLDSIVLWHPVLYGREEVRQLERLHRVSGAISESATRPGEELLETLRRCDIVELAGYRVASKLLLAMQGMHLAEQAARIDARLQWIELVADSSQGIPKRRVRVAREIVGRFDTASIDMVEDIKFWTTTEISTSEKVLSSTQAFLTERND